MEAHWPGCVRQIADQRLTFNREKLILSQSGSGIADILADTRFYAKKSTYFAGK
jgi:hypothetical protein